MVDLNSISWDIDPKCIILSWVVLLFLFLSFQVLKQFLPPHRKTKDIQKVLKQFLPTHRKNKEIQKVFKHFVHIHRTNKDIQKVFKQFVHIHRTNKDIQKHQGTKRRKSGGFKGRRTCQREAEQERKLLSILKSPLGQNSDIIHFRQLLCPDPLCRVCNRTTAKVSQLLCKASLQDAANSVSRVSSRTSVKESSVFLSAVVSAIPPGASISAPLPESTLLSSSVLSPEKVTPLSDLPSPSSLGDSLPPEPVPPLISELPVGQVPPEPPISTPPPPPPPHDSEEEAKSIFQPETTLSLVDSPDGLSTNVQRTTSSTDSASLVMSKSSRKQSYTENLSPSKLEHSDDDKTLLDSQPSEASYERNTTAILVEHRNLSFLSPDVLALLERQIKKKSDLQMQNKKEKKAKSFPKELNPDNQLTSSEKMVDLVANQQDSPVSVPLQSSEGKSEQLQVHQQSPDLKTLEDNLQKKCFQFYWGLASLHSESLNPIVPVSGDCTTYVYFNMMSTSTTAHESPVVPHPPTLPLPEIQSQPLTQTLSQSPVPPQDELQVSVPILSPPPTSQVSSSEVCTHRVEDEAQPLMPSEIHDLEYNILQKGQESMWGLPSVVQKSKEDFCPPAPNLLAVRQSSKAYNPITILPGDFPLKKELRLKLEHHLRKRLIQHRWGLPRRVHESVSSINPQTEIPKISESKSTYGLSWISLYKGQSSKDFKLSLPRSSHEGSSELLPLGEKVKKVNSPEIGTKDYPLSHPEGAPDNGLDSDIKTKLKIELSCLFKTKSSSIQNKLTEALEIHLSKKFEEIHETQVPGTVNRSWHSMEPVLSCPEKPPSQMKNSDLALLVGEKKGLNTSQDISFLPSKKQKMLEDHIKVFHKRLMCGLPHKVQESIDIFNTKGTPSWSSVISGKDSKIGGSKPLKESFNTFHGDKVGTINSVPILDHPLPATSPVSKESKALRHSPSHTNHELTENVKTIEGDRQTLLPFPHSDIDKESQKQTVIANQCSPKQPTRQAGARPKSWNKGASPSISIENTQRKLIKNLEYSLIYTKSREIFKAKELCAIRSQSTNSLRTTESERISVKSVNMTKVEPALTTERPPEGISVLKDSESSGLKNQLHNELKMKMESREHGLTPSFSTKLSLALHKLTSKTSTHLQSASSGDPAASQVLQAHYDRRINIEQGQEPWIPTQVSGKCQDQNVPLVPKRVCPLVPRTGEFGGGDAGLVIGQPRGKPPNPQDKTLKEALGSKSSLAPSLKGQSPSGNSFTNQIKQFFQRLCPTIKTKGQEGSLKKGSSSSSVESRNLGKRRAAFTGNTEAQKIMTDIEKILEGQLVGRHGVEATTPQKPLSTLMKSKKIQPKSGLQVQAELVQKHAFNIKTPCAKVPSAKSYSQEVGIAGQRYPTGNKWVMDRGRHLQKSVTLQDKICQRHYPSMPHKEPMFHPNTSCKCRVGQVAPAATTVAKGTMLGELSLLFKQKMLLQNFQKENFLPHK